MEFEEWWEFYYGRHKLYEDHKYMALAGWRAKEHLDFMRSLDDEPSWKKAVEKEKEREERTKKSDL